MKNPLVSVVCLCYNQEKFVREALDSVINQSYKEVELIIVDDASTDGSAVIINHWLADHPNIPFVELKVNQGNTTAFNQGLKHASGKYIIDLAADDVLMPERIEKQVTFFEDQKSNVGVIYSDAQYIDEEGEALEEHFSDQNMIPYEGDIYEKVIDTFFIPPPTMMIRMEVMKELNGYDESLVYEDFDFWIRSSRRWHYAFQSEALTAIRRVMNSHSANYYSKSDRKLSSTVCVCEKILELNKEEAEQLALINRLKYEIRHAFLAGRKKELLGFFEIWKKMESIPNLYLIAKCIGYLGMNLNWLNGPLRSIFK